MAEKYPLPPKWHWTTLKSILKPPESGSRPRGGVRGIPDGIPSIGGEHLCFDGGFDFSNIRYIPKSFYEKMNKGKIKKDDVLVVKDGATTGKTSYISGNFPFSEAAINEHVFILRPINNNLLSKYLFFWMLSPYGQRCVVDNFKGTAQGGINTSFINNSNFPLAPLDEQCKIITRIEELFSQLDAGVSGLKRIQALLKKYRASVLKAAFEGRLVPQHPDDEPAGDMLRRLGKEPLERDDLTPLPDGWVWTLISDVADINKRHPKLRELPDDYQVTFVPMAAVDAYSGAISNPEIRNLGSVRKGFTSFIEHDVIFAKITPCMQNGKAAIARKLHNGIGFGSTEFHVIRPNQSVIPDWLYFYIRQESFRNEAAANFSGTAGQMRVPKSFIEGHSLPLPPLHEQSRIVEELEHQFSVIDEFERQVIKSLIHSKILRQAVLKFAFEGKLIHA